MKNIALSLCAINHFHPEIKRMMHAFSKQRKRIKEEVREKREKICSAKALSKSL